MGVGPINVEIIQKECYPSVPHRDSFSWQRSPKGYVTELPLHPNSVVSYLGSLSLAAPYVIPRGSGRFPLSSLRSQTQAMV